MPMDTKVMVRTARCFVGAGIKLLFVGLGSTERSGHDRRAAQEPASEGKRAGRDSRRRQRGSTSLRYHVTSAWRMLRREHVSVSGRHSPRTQTAGRRHRFDRSRVVTRDPRFGNGIALVKMLPEDSDKLARFIDSASPPAAVGGARTSPESQRSGAGRQALIAHSSWLIAHCSWLMPHGWRLSTVRTFLLPNPAVSSSRNPRHL